MTRSFPKPNRPLLLAAAVFFLGSVFLLLFGTRSIRARSAEEIDAIRRFTAEAENDRQNIAKLPELRDQATLIARDSGTIDIFLPEDRVAEFIRETESIARDAGGAVVISDGKNLDAARDEIVKPKARAVRTGDPAATEVREGSGLLASLPDGKTIGFTLSFTGTYSDALEFLRRLEAAPYAVDILSMDIGPADPESAGSMSDRSDLFSSPESRSEDPASASDTGPVDGVTAIFSVIIYLE